MDEMIPEIRLEPGREADAVILVHELGEVVFQLLVQVQRAVQKSRPGAAGAVFPDCGNCGFFQLRMGGQAQVVVGAEHQQALALDDNPAVGFGVNRPEIGIETGPLGFADYRIIVMAFLENVHAGF